MTPIYKILDAADWALTLAQGSFAGTPLDRKDGYIHLSGADQLEETARKHFAGRDNLVLLTLNADHSPLAALIRREPSRGGALFPHLYGALQAAWVDEARPLRVDDQGVMHIGEATT